MEDDDSTPDEDDVDVENQYYHSKQLKETDPRAALDSFEEVCELGPKHWITDLMSEV